MKQDMTPALDALPPPGVVETLDFERILDAHRADLLARHPEAAESWRWRASRSTSCWRRTPTASCCTGRASMMWRVRI